uniref:Retrovirus-related Pol polyprotein from type-1 retrotransposable element R1 2 n=1 Tax=Schizaphis graminum TaxID=13262 RepID=A0A2S2P6S8_SCHGA
MRLEFPDGVHIVCFADDAAIIATGHTTWLLERAMNDSLDMVAQWMRNQGLTISSSKSAAVMLTTKRGYEMPSFRISNTVIEMKSSVRYLGIELCSVLGFRKHVEEASNKAMKTASALSRLMPNVGGPSPNKRMLLTSVVHSQLLYAAPIWHGALIYERNKKTLAAPQRKMALRICSAYRTVSTEAAAVVAGIFPIHLLALEKALEKRARGNGTPADLAKSESRSCVEDRWQNEWDTAENGRWTHRIIPTIKPWLQRKHGKIGYHLTQALTGHGCFNSYLKRFNKREDSVCFYCQHPMDDAEHTIFQCDRWWRLRRELEVAVRSTFEPETMVAIMLSSKSRWKKVEKFVIGVLSTKEEDERVVQARIIVN